MAKALTGEDYVWQAWHEKNSTTYVQPKMYQKPVSAHKLWHTVMAYGGYDAVRLLCMCLCACGNTLAMRIGGILCASVCVPHFVPW